MSANLAYINPKIIAWARKLRSATFEQLETSQLKASQIKAWEEGRGLPTHAQAEALANKLQLPLVVLFLSDPPVMDIPVPDLRTVSGAPVRDASVEFSRVISKALVQRDWYREDQLRRNRSPFPFVGRFAITDNFQSVAADISRTLHIDDQLRRTSTSWREFLNLLILNTELQGILVFRSALVGHATTRKLKVDEFRGFALSDSLAPVIFINDEDAKAAQVFTLVHELVHIWIGQTGISDPNLKKRSEEFTNAIERFCNRVAAEVLVPEQDFIARWPSSLPLLQNVNRLASYYRVSSLVVLIRAHELHKISDSQFSTTFDAELSRFRIQDKKEKQQEEKRQKRSGNFWASFVIRNSRRFTDIVVRSAREGHSRYTDAASLLGVNASTFERYLRKLTAS